MGMGRVVGTGGLDVAEWGTECVGTGKVGATGWEVRISEMMGPDASRDGRPPYLGMHAK